MNSPRTSRLSRLIRSLMDASVTDEHGERSVVVEGDCRYGVYLGQLVRQSGGVYSGRTGLAQLRRDMKAAGEFALAGVCLRWRDSSRSDFDVTVLAGSHA